MTHEPKQHHIGYEISKSDLPPSRHDRLMRKLERQIAKASPKAHLTLAKLLKANEVQCSGSKLAVGPFRQAPELSHVIADKGVLAYWGGLHQYEAERKGEA